MTPREAAEVLSMLADLRRRMPEASSDPLLVEACRLGAEALRRSCGSCEHYSAREVECWHPTRPILYHPGEDFSCALWTAREEQA